jgi:hypothetical protein
MPDTNPVAPNPSAPSVVPPAQSWFHKFLVSLENLLGIHPSNNVATSAAQNELKAIAADNLSDAEVAQLDKTLQAILAARNAANQSAPPVASTVSS